MDSNSVARVITITPKPEKLDEILAQATQLAKEIEAAEPVCLQYKVSRTKPFIGAGPDQIVMTTIFKDEEAFIAHGETPHVQAYWSDTREDEFFSAPPEVRVIEPAGGFSRV